MEEVIVSFLINLVAISLNIAISYATFLSGFYNLDCWSTEKWKALNEKVKLIVPDIHCYYNIKSNLLKLANIQRTEINIKLKQSLSASKFFSYGEKNIELFRPRLILIFYGLLIAFFLAWIFTIPIAFGYKIINFLSIDSFITFGSIAVVITAIQLFFYNQFRVENIDTNTVDIPIRKLTLSYEGSFYVPDNRLIIDQNKLGYMSIYETNSKKADLKEFSGKELSLFVSIKSKKFSKNLITYLADNIIPKFGKLSIILVTKPYIANLNHEFQGLALEREAQKIERIASEKRAMIDSVLKDKDEIKYSYFGWDETSNSVPSDIRNEIISTLNNKDSKFYKDCISQVCSTNNINPDKAHLYLDFLKEELPVLINWYYKKAVFDIYPDVNSPIFHKLEKGIYKNELIFISQMAIKKPLKYILVKRVG